MKIEELKEGALYSFDEVILYSYMLPMHCKKCHNHLFYDYRFDASFCPHCNNWVENPIDMNDSCSLSDEERKKYPIADKIPEMFW